MIVVSIKKIIFNALMIKYTFKAMDMLDQLLLIRFNYVENSYRHNYADVKLFCQATKILF